MSGAGYVGILSVELHFPEAGSLKGKRKYVKSAKAQLQQRFGVASFDAGNEQRQETFEQVGDAAEHGTLPPSCALSARTRRIKARAPNASAV